MDIPITKEFNKAAFVGEARLVDEAVELLQTGMFRLEPGLILNPETNTWEIVELSIVKDNSVDRKRL